MKFVRDITFTKAEKINLGEMTKDLKKAGIQQKLKRIKTHHSQIKTNWFLLIKYAYMCLLNNLR